MAYQSTATKATVWLSRRCQSIYRNLALEDWIFSRNSFVDRDGLLIWRNRSAAVVGRHQNPWSELNVDYARENSVDVVRRRSGGGAVYHDLGNVNICFFTNKARHRRDDNLRLVAKVLKEKWDVDTEVSKRHDLFLDGKYKISGTAAKLSHDKAYHHFTLMLDVDVNHLWSVLRPSLPGIASKATPSIRSEVKTLADTKKGIEYETLVQAIVDEFRSRYQTTELHEIDAITGDQFENIDSTVDEFSSWQWTFGTTPPFSVSTTFVDENNLTLTIFVEKGLIARFSIDKKIDTVDDTFLNTNFESILNSSVYIGCRFEPMVYRKIIDWVRS